MKVTILGNGLEGQSAAKYFERHGAEVEIVEQIDPQEARTLKFAGDLVLRSPSIPPSREQEWSSGTKYFLTHCPAPVVGVTGTKGKGTTCSLIASVLRALGRTVHLVGNIGAPALDVLDEIQADDVVVYEMSSFQLWDVTQSPRVAVVLHIEPDHLNVHTDFDEYVGAKANVAKYQGSGDACVFNAMNADSCRIAAQGAGQKVGYPVGVELANGADQALAGTVAELDAAGREQLEKALDSLVLVGRHNRENAQAALLAVAAITGVKLADLLDAHFDEVCAGLHDFKGLPHRLEFVRELNHVRYFDDNFATGVSSMEVSLKSFPEAEIVLIAGGRDKTDNADIPEITERILAMPNLAQAVLIGESGHEIYRQTPDAKFVVAESLAEAVTLAQAAAEKAATAAGKTGVVVMSPAAASFDMFKNAYERGDQYQELVRGLK